MADLIDILPGTWVGTGRGRYPTIQDFGYEETVVLSRLPGKPVVAYSQRTRSVEGDPLHAESGYFRFGEEGVELVIAQPTGIAEAHRGRIVDNRMEFQQSGLALTPTAVEVKEVRRVVHVAGNVMTYRLDMAAVGQPLTFHLEARLERTSQPEGR